MFWECLRNIGTILRNVRFRIQNRGLLHGNIRLSMVLVTQEVKMEKFDPLRHERKDTCARKVPSDKHILALVLVEAPK